MIWVRVRARVRVGARVRARVVCVCALTHAWHPRAGEEIAHGRVAAEARAGTDSHRGAIGRVFLEIFTVMNIVWNQI